MKSTHKEPEESILMCNSSCQIEHTLRHRIPNILPTVENSADDLDNLDDVFTILVTKICLIFNQPFFFICSYFNSLVIQALNV